MLAKANETNLTKTRKNSMERMRDAKASVLDATVVLEREALRCKCSFANVVEECLSQSGRPTLMLVPSEAREHLAQSVQHREAANSAGDRETHVQFPWCAGDEEVGGAASLQASRTISCWYRV